MFSHIVLRMNRPSLYGISHRCEQYMYFLHGPSKNPGEQSESEGFEALKQLEEVESSNLLLWAQIYVSS